jgi:hypothetical protein
VGGNDAVGARPRRAGTVGRIVVVWVRKRAGGSPCGVGVSAARRRRALVSRLHGGGGGGVGDGVDVVFGGDGDALEAELELRGLGGGGTGQRVAARGQRGRAAAGVGVPAQADRLRGQEDAAQHDCQPVKHETRGAKGTNEKDETEGAELIRNWTYMLVLICVNHRTSQASRLPTRVPGSWSSVRTEKRQPEASKQAGCESDTIRPKWCGVV